MMRVIVTPAVPGDGALAELKDWLGITTSLDDGALTLLLAAALEVCADFTGLVPLACGLEESLPLPPETRGPPLFDTMRRSVPGPDAFCLGDWPGWQRLDTRPVIGISGVSGVSTIGARVPLDPGAWQMRVDADGACWLRVTDPGMFYRCVVEFTAGLAPGWDTLPAQISHGIIRLAAEQYRNRDGAAGTLPPASVIALWLPWRRVRLT